eukprot:7064658-Pyramimonas_sp.AAC.1
MPHPSSFSIPAPLSQLPASSSLPLPPLPPKAHNQIAHVAWGAQQDLVPSATTLKRHKLTLDVGFLMYMRKENERILAGNRVSVYQSCDSSPVGKQNMLNTWVCKVTQSDMLQ